MRLTLTLDDELLQELKAHALRSNLPLKDVVNRALREGLRGLRSSPQRRRFRTKTYPMGRPKGVKLDKALDMAASIGDREAIRKMAPAR